MNPLLLAMIQALMQRSAPAARPAARAQGQPQSLARAMAGGKRPAPNQKDLSLAALKPYSESDYADRYGPTPSPSTGAFEQDAFENDGFQVF